MADISDQLKDLLVEHQRLRTRQDELGEKRVAGETVAGGIREVAAEARLLIEACAVRSEHISADSDRERLLKIIDHWGPFILRETGEYAPSSIKPPSKGLTWVDMTWEKLLDASRRKVQTFLDGKVNEGVYKQQWAVPRMKMNQKLKEFQESDFLALILTGQAGMGKTFWLCQIAQESLDRQEAWLLLPYDSNELSRRICQLQLEPTSRFSDVIGQIIANDLGYPDVAALEKELNYLDHLLEDESCHLLICVDSVETFKSDGRTAEHLVIAIDALVEHFAISTGRMHRIRFMITALDTSWEWLGGEKLISSSLYFRAVMEPFNQQEFEAAYKNYVVEQNRGKGQFEKLWDICDGHPYLSRIAADLVNQNSRVTGRAVFEGFYQRRVLRGSSGDKAQIEQFLDEFVQRYDRKLAGTPAAQVDLDDPAYAILSLDGILTQEAVGTPFTRFVLKLKPNGLLEHLRQRFRPGILSWPIRIGR